ncbi:MULTISPECIES: hypothetical protein [unclassified Cytobacillus]|uniref:hypothetical protein n=1 Tax=unclassified Cytobacillus TaxID=2675268 RepID=UPI00135C7BE1|nr:hypothetical protein [Cytobacillus sp. AMY 15.2]KAF0817530.1 beta-lactamase [Bacillus sp. ZZV12-4809]MCM3089704.1 DUF4185 domain-containing protein [Cytobacillus sp. AMY 15.2]
MKTKLKGASIILTSAVLLGTSFLNFSPLGAIAKDEGKVGQSYGKVNQNNVKSVPNAKKKDQKDTIVTPEESTFFSTVSIEENSSYNTPSDGDLWPAAWSDDDMLYTANGDGKGFDLNAPWSDIVVNQITAGHPSTKNITGKRLSSGDQVGTVWNDPYEYNRKPTGMISVDGNLYLAVQDLNKGGGWRAFNDAPSATILKSADKGKTWTWDKEKPMFDDYVFTTIMFLDYGKDSENNSDGYVYAYGLDYNWRDSFIDTVEDPTNLYLARVPKTKIQDRSAWEFYAGDLNGNPKWKKNIKQRKPVLQDERRVYSNTLHATNPDNSTVLSQGSVVYNKPLNRYIYTSWTEFTFEFYESPTPYGPWKKFLSKDFGVYPWFNHHHGGYGVVMPSKYISDDGTEMWLNSNTFMGGVQKYSLSFRKLKATPYKATEPANESSDNNLALPANSSNVTPVSKYSAHNSNLRYLNDGNKNQSEDDWNGERKQEDWWGYTWSQAYNMNKVVYTTGNMFNDGGWFNDIKVQVRQNFKWVDVNNLQGAPAYPNSKDAGKNQTYTFTFDKTWGDGVRIIGAPGGTAAFTSIGELEVYYK